MTSADHGAAASALGYLYQFDWALVEALEAYPQAAGRRLLIEKLDDLAWEDADGVPVALEQLKHRGPSAGPLTDMQADVWSTVQVWLDAGPAADPDGPQLKLVTTQVAQPGSGMEALRPAPGTEALRADRVASAADRLESAARDSKSDATARARRRFLELSRAERIALLSRVRVLDGSLPIQELPQRLTAALGQAMPRVGGSLFLQQLRGWWSAAVLRLLTDEQRTVRVDDVHDAVARIRDQFTPVSLPTTVSQDDVRRHLDAGRSRRFVRQLEWVDAHPTYIEIAILDYYRAYAQRAAWATEDLIGLDELQGYEQRLREDWARRYAEAAAELPANATEADKATAGRRLLSAVMNETTVLLREHYRDQFFAAGTRHFLADGDDATTAIGWHPEFRRRLEALLVPGPAATA